MEHSSAARPRRSPMGAGSLALGLAAWTLVAVAIFLRVPHELAGVALMIALSGFAVAREGKRVEENVSARLQNWGLAMNVAAMLAAIASIAVEILRRRIA